MGCVSSNLLHHDKEYTQLGSSALSQHIVSLTSTTYGLLNLDPTPTIPTPRFTLGSIFPSPLSDLKSELKSHWSEPKSLRSQPDIINSWELMAGLDTDSFRFSPLPPPSQPKQLISPNFSKYSIDSLEQLCPPDGEEKVIIYTTALRGVRKTFEGCNAIRAAMESFGVVVIERDVSMDKGFREELKDLMKGKERELSVPPRVFVKGRYLGGVEEVMRMMEEGCLGGILAGCPMKKGYGACEGCRGGRWLPCFQCNGSCKMVMVVKERECVTGRCSECNENGLVQCPICS